MQNMTESKKNMLPMYKHSKNFSFRLARKVSQCFSLYTNNPFLSKRSYVQYISNSHFRLPSSSNFFTNFCWWNMSQKIELMSVMS